MSHQLAELILDGVQNITSPVWFSRGPNQPPYSVNDNGSCGFVAAGDHRFLVTAKHVVDGFRAAKQMHSETIFAVNVGDGHTVTLEAPEIIDESDALDLATIKFPHLEYYGNEVSKVYFPLDLCPPRRAQKLEPVSIVGFPGHGRQGFETFGRFEPFPITMHVTNVSDRRIILVDEHETVRFERNGRYVEEGIELGGFSGSPAIATSLQGQFYLAGIVTDGSPRLGCKGFPGHVCLGSAEYLLPDGRFDHMRMPWQ